MPREIAVDELRESLQAVLDEVAARGETYVLTRGNDPEAALISYRDFQRLRRWDQKEREILADWAAMRARQAEVNPGEPSQEELDEITAAVEEVRAEIWAEEQRKTGAR